MHDHVARGAVLAWLACAVIALRPHHAPVRMAIRVADSPLARSLALDVWSEQANPLDIVVTERELAALAAAGVHWDVLVPDIDAVARAERERVSAHQPGDFFGEYRDYRAIVEHLHELAATVPGVRVEGIGSTLDGRTIWALHAGTPGGTKLLIDGTEHAREWIATMTATCVADRLVHDPEFLATTELWVVPVVNPDGYQYSWSTDRYWRKNRRGSYGVDLNRNFSVAWGGSGSSNIKRSEVYRGERPFSEPESIALRDLAQREHVALHVDFHSYGQLLLFPWSYTAAPARDRDRFAALGDRMASAMFAQHQTRYALTQAVELYPAAGTAMDYMYGEVGATSFTIELRPKSGTGFVLPPDQIRPTCDEGLAAVRELRAAR